MSYKYLGIIYKKDGDTVKKTFDELNSAIHFSKGNLLKMDDARSCAVFGIDPDNKLFEGVHTLPEMVYYENDNKGRERYYQGGKSLCEPWMHLDALLAMRAELDEMTLALDDAIKKLQRVYDVITTAKCQSDYRMLFRELVASRNVVNSLIKLNMPDKASIVTGVVTFLFSINKKVDKLENDLKVGD